MPAVFLPDSGKILGFFSQWHMLFPCQPLNSGLKGLLLYDGPAKGQNLKESETTSFRVATCTNLVFFSTVGKVLHLQLVLRQ